ncbi:MAG: phosphate signaling complex protein PhoU [Deltaproteobacteria bacterium]|nr:phosphate signaling complex protein PhoU [Deltaproteobacteria bacterium]
MTEKHTDREYEKELTTLRERLLLMAGRVEQMIAQAVKAFVERDMDTARQVVSSDRLVDRDEVEIDRHCLVILAKRQPMASDLRFITIALKMVTDLERIGDLAVNLCERAVDLSGAAQVLRADSIAAMGRMVEEMVRDSIDAFVEGDIGKARAVLARDREVDLLYHATFREVLARMRAEESLVETGIHVQSAAKLLERMGDHATNVAEQVVYMVEGRDIRHSSDGALGSIPAT